MTSTIRVDQTGWAARPAGAPWWRQGPWQLWVFFLGIVLIYFKDVPMLVVAMAGVEIPQQYSALMSLLLLLAFALLSAAVARGRLRADDLGLIRPPLVPSLIGIVIAIAALYLPLLLSGGEGQDTSGFLGQGLALDLAMIALISILGPVAEEFAFRGVLFRSAFDGLARWLPPKVAGGIAVVASAFVFMAVHVGAPALHLLSYFLYGLALAGLYWYTGSLYPPMVAHLLSNTYASMTTAVTAGASPAVVALAILSPVFGCAIALVIGKALGRRT